MSRAARAQVLKHAQLLQPAGLARTTSGNVSARIRGGMLITPTGMPYDALEGADLVPLRLDGSPLGRPGRAPSSEWHFHAALYAERPDVGGVVHAHAPFATVLAIHGKAIPAVHYMVAAAGGADIRCAPYATFGTRALADNVVAAMADRKACLLRHHGLVAVGRDVASAFKLALEVEELAEQYWRALQLGTPPVLDDGEMARVLEKFRSYGHPARSAEKGRRR